MSGEPEVYDLVTLGAGSGGVRASRFAASLYGAKVRVVPLATNGQTDDDAVVAPITGEGSGGGALRTIAGAVTTIAACIVHACMHACILCASPS